MNKVLTMVLMEKYSILGFLNSFPRQYSNDNVIQYYQSRRDHEHFLDLINSKKLFHR